MPDGQAPLSAFGGKADMKNVGMVLDKFLILIGMVRFAPDQCLGPRAWLSMFVHFPLEDGAAERRAFAPLRTGAAKSMFGFSRLHERTDPSR
ncbi:MAG: hypothetical protein WB036_08610 [Pseudolabrys sp.]|jgi:hypothetical protein